MQAAGSRTHAVAPHPGAFDFLVSDVRAAGKTVADGVRAVLWLGGDSPSATSYRQVAGGGKPGAAAQDGDAPIRWHGMRTSIQSITPSKSGAGTTTPLRSTVSVLTQTPATASLSRTVTTTPSSSSSSSASVSSSASSRLSTPQAGAGSGPVATPGRFDSKGGAIGRDMAREAPLCVQTPSEMTGPQRLSLNALTEHLAKLENAPDGSNTGAGIFRATSDQTAVEAIRHGLRSSDGGNVGRSIDEFLTKVVLTVNWREQHRPRRWGGLRAAAPWTEAQRREALIQAFNDRLRVGGQLTAGDGMRDLIGKEGRAFLAEVARCVAAWEQGGAGDGSKKGSARYAVRNALLFYTLGKVAADRASDPMISEGDQVLYRDLSWLCSQLGLTPKVSAGQRPSLLEQMQMSLGDFMASLVPGSPAA